MNNIIYILLMALTSWCIRTLPLTIFRKPIKSQFIQSFLYYVPYITLAVMTFPAIVNETEVWWSGAVALVLGIIASYKGAGLFKTTLICCLSVVLLEMFI